MSMEQTSDAEALVRVLEAVEALPGAAALRARSYDLLHLTSGAVAVDVGCGAGRAVAELTERGAAAVGVDVSDQMIAIARRRSSTADLRLGSAYDLPFADGQVAGYRADKVFHELHDPKRAVGEARRVLAPEGRIVLLGQDWDSFVIDSADPELTREIMRARSNTIPSPRSARGYRNLLLDVGFVDVTAEVHTPVFTDSVMLPMLVGLADTAHSVGAITPEQADAWKTEQTERAYSHRLFLALPLFVASARRA
ncbi:methyltransferase domain-containing protein [Actinopolymorpha pittospori]|uniref:SAM-dependent methyltransferase n=1 Tax=Actinopolymorpha pittospori TaxID=648752 RepID=A0A927RCG1_9ACTN|nr:methyltransferase domain-containing protein [Actinopolymorpha pittospori]MBE1607080.1 SAM-dependent methyltransferase [Actinopolymorpha pittospori]